MHETYFSLADTCYCGYRIFFFFFFFHAQKSLEDLLYNHGSFIGISVTAFSNRTKQASVNLLKDGIALSGLNI